MKITWEGFPPKVERKISAICNLYGLATTEHLPRHAGMGGRPGFNSHLAKVAHPGPRYRTHSHRSARGFKITRYKEYRNENPE